MLAEIETAMEFHVKSSYMLNKPLYPPEFAGLEELKKGWHDYPKNYIYSALICLVAAFSISAILIKMEQSPEPSEAIREHLAARSDTHAHAAPACNQ